MDWKSNLFALLKGFNVEDVPDIIEFIYKGKDSDRGMHGSRYNRFKFPSARAEERSNHTLVSKMRQEGSDKLRYIFK